MAVGDGIKAVRQMVLRPDGKWEFVGINKTQELIYVEAQIVVTDEPFVSAYDTPVSLANNNIQSGTVVVTTYIEGSDYTIDYAAGTITVLSTGNMIDATSYLIDYKAGLGEGTANYVVGSAGQPKTIKEYDTGATSGAPAKLTTFHYTDSVNTTKATKIIETASTV